jgi:hypothetical protein
MTAIKPKMVMSQPLERMCLNLISVGAVKRLGSGCSRRSEGFLHIHMKDFLCKIYRYLSQMTSVMPIPLRRS